MTIRSQNILQFNFLSRNSKLSTANRAKEYYRSHKVDERRKRENLPLNISQMFLQSVNITCSPELIANWTAHEEPKKFVKSPCYVTIDISRAFPPKQTQVKICLQIQRELSGGQFSLSLYLKLFRTISNSSYNTTASSRHRSV